MWRGALSNLSASAGGIANPEQRERFGAFGVEVESDEWLDTAQRLGFREQQQFGRNVGFAVAVRRRGERMVIYPLSGDEPAVERLVVCIAVVAESRPPSSLPMMRRRSEQSLHDAGQRAESVLAKLFPVT